MRAHITEHMRSNSKGRIMILTDREKRIMEEISAIGRANISMKQIADRLGVSYDYLLHKRCEILRKNGYLTFTGFLCDYVRETAKEGR